MDTTSRSATASRCGGQTAGGAPPRDIDGQSAAATLSFKAHTAHVTQSDHPAYGCQECHRKPTTALSPGHNFDGSKGTAEVAFLAGLSPAGTYGGNGSCSTLYCHGNGRTNNGTATDAMAAPACSGCHPFLNSSETQWATMSGDHRKHLKETGITCYDCHANTVNAGNAITLALNHVNGSKEVKFGTSALTWTNGACTGSCHGKNHNAKTW